jgi:hypothetical protein
MANPLTQFLNNRFFQPAVYEGVEKALAQTQPMTVGVRSLPESGRGADTLGTPSSLVANAKQCEKHTTLNRANELHGVVDQEHQRFRTQDALGALVSTRSTIVN